MPSLVRDREEVIEYFAIVALVTLFSNLIAWLFRDRRALPRAH
jgi:hypothetical protein